jgi:hypothetical protein
MDLAKYREVVGPYYRAQERKRKRKFLRVTDAYEQATGQSVYAAEDVVAWVMANGQLTAEALLGDMLDRALCGRADDLCRHARATDNFLFLVDPARLVRAIEEALATLGVDAADGEVFHALPSVWRELAEAPPDAPFPFPLRLVALVLGAVRRGELRADG